jgi:hypothetical protein
VIGVDPAGVPKRAAERAARCATEAAARRAPARARGLRALRFDAPTARPAFRVECPCFAPTGAPRRRRAAAPLVKGAAPPA